MLIFYMTASEAEYPLILLLWKIVRGYNYIATVCYAAAHTVIVLLALNVSVSFCLLFDWNIGTFGLKTPLHVLGERITMKLSCIKYPFDAPPAVSIAGALVDRDDELVLEAGRTPAGMPNGAPLG